LLLLLMMMMLLLLLVLMMILLLLVWAVVKALAALAAQSSRKRLPRSACGPLEFLPSRACTSILHVALPHDTQAATWPRRRQLAPTAALFDKADGGGSEARLLVPSFDDVLRYLSAVSPDRDQLARFLTSPIHPHQLACPPTARIGIRHECCTTEALAA
jgi:hypothetical protein